MSQIHLEPLELPNLGKSLNVSAHGCLFVLCKLSQFAFKPWRVVIWPNNRVNHVEAEELRLQFQFALVEFASNFQFHRSYRSGFGEGILRFERLFFQLLGLIGY